MASDWENKLTLIFSFSLANLIGFVPHLNESAPFNPAEYKAVYKTNITYHDFTFGNTLNKSCEYPRFWDESGNIVTAQSDGNFSELNGCFESEFDQVCCAMAIALYSLTST